MLCKLLEASIYNRFVPSDVTGVFIFGRRVIKSSCGDQGLRFPRRMLHGEVPVWDADARASERRFRYHMQSSDAATRERPLCT